MMTKTMCAWTCVWLRGSQKARGSLVLDPTQPGDRKTVPSSISLIYVWPGWDCVFPPHKVSFLNSLCTYRFSSLLLPGIDCPSKAATQKWPVLASGYFVKTILMVEMICTSSVYFSENYSNGVSQTERSIGITQNYFRFTENRKKH